MTVGEAIDVAEAETEPDIKIVFDPVLENPIPGGKPVIVAPIALPPNWYSILIKFSVTAVKGLS